MTMVKAVGSGNKRSQRDWRAPGTDLNGVFASFGEFLRGAAPARLRPQAVQRVMREVTGAAGGFLVPEEFREQVLAISLDTTVVRPRAMVLPMSKPKLPVPSVRAASNVSGTLFGGLSWGWAKEGETLDSALDSVTLGRVNLEAHRAFAYLRASEELVFDAAGAFDEFLTVAAGQSHAYAEDAAFLTGTGAGQPLGILNSPALVTVEKETGQSAKSVLWDNVTNMHGRMLPDSHARAIWACNPNVLPQLERMTISVGTGGGSAPLRNGPTGLELLGRPVIPSSKLPPLGTVGDLLYVDLSYYVIGDRMLWTIDSSPVPGFSRAELDYRIIARVDGRPIIDMPIVPEEGTEDLSPFVALETRS